MGVGVAGGPNAKEYGKGRRKLLLAAFARDKNRGDGLRTYRRECVAEHGAAHSRRRPKAVGKPVREKAGVPAAHKLCRARGEIEPHGEWHRNTTASDGLSTRGKTCRAIRGRRDHPKRRYGLTRAERDELITSRGGACCTCLPAPPEHVDHCRRTGRVRGVLCFSCNAALGQFKDRPDAMRRAAAYVEGNAWKPTLVAPGVYQLPS
ncbi:endonuclease VII domain-containing protein [Streptomyces sp. NPDC056160]|uniref:endonuclease VII domain-containing protein n=1 Tax=Streptomyces sp. NPDC056160 TaxID=3345731 RepID=UPI0035E1D367